MERADLIQLAMADKPCTNDPELWFDTHGYAARTPKKFCQACPVIDICLEYALEYEVHHSSEVWGVYGGMSPVDRAPLIAQRRKELGYVKGTNKRITVAEAADCFDCGSSSELPCECESPGSDPWLD